MKHQSGFTLLEMLAALMLMAICSTVLLVAFGQSARSLSQVNHSDRLTHVAALR
jgi:general secretion pathway protein I